MDKSNNVSHITGIEKQIACEWVAKLDRGNLTPEESAKLTEWLAQDPVNREALTMQIQEWSDMDILRELAYLEAADDERSQNSWLSSLRLFPKPVMAICSAMLVIVTVAFVSQSDINWNDFGHSMAGQDDIALKITTVVGEQKQTSLPDGSVVHVNTTTAAEISYSSEERSVVLEVGEAFFDVAPETDRPFVVYAGDTQVRAIGTAFSVFTEDDKVSVFVTEGSVEFISADIVTLITASRDGEKTSDTGNVAVYADDQIMVDTQPADLLSRRLAWQEGMLEFRGESLQHVISELSRYTDSEIVILDDDIKDVRLGGYFKIGDMEGLASTLAMGFGIDVEVVSDSLIQVSKRQAN